MTTIKERAKEQYDHAAMDRVTRKSFEREFAAGAEWMRAKLTRWNDPKENLPKEHTDVEVKTDKGTVSVCNMELDEKGRRFWNVSRTNYMIPDVHIVGWREIYE